MDGITKSRLANPDVWYMILKQTVQASDTHTPETLYEVIIPHLLGKDMYEFVEDDLMFSGNWERPQKAGTCYYRCLLCALRYLMKQYDFTIDQQRQLFMFIRVNYLNLVMDHLQNEIFVRDLTESDIYLINLACGETGMMANNLCSRLEKILPKAERDNNVALFLSRINQCCEQVKRLLPKNADDNAHSVMDINYFTSQQLTISANAPLIPFSNFNLLADESDRDKKKGYRASGTVPVYLDLL